MGTDIFHREEGYKPKPGTQIPDPTHGDLLQRAKELKEEIRNIVKYLSLGNRERLRDFAEELLTSQKKISGNGGNK